MAAPGSIAATPFWLKFALVLSLAVNLAFFGAFGGAILGLTADPRDDEAERRLPFLLRVMPESRHEQARALLADSRAARDESGREEVQQETLAAIRAEPFDPARLEAAFTRWREASMDRRTATQSHIVTIAGQMTPEERAEMAERMEAMIARWRERRAAREAAIRSE